MIEFADAPSTQVDVQIDAPAAVVWPLLRDIDVPASCSPEFLRAGRTDDLRGMAAGIRDLSEGSTA